ncbi:cytoskeletal protein RodZ [Chthoniobacter flavus]|uniref:helix-turn-helix domain-containing protein n=1 Tax=Chthoniobacter flavus TaxID=191863 RepID=UPI00104FBDEF|nr:helix-turn-helix domain-containing protein [Chthoniobacter flavus]TCO94126.1 cytoskeletal protein RodZ [Chthoniobacter flavus]
MVESVGKKLNQARLKRGLTIDEAAHATKLRPDKINALEADDYSRFANNIYAKGFLQIYARFLNVDVSDFSRTLDNANPISVSDYQYLSNAPTPRREVTRVERDERKPPSLAPLFFFVIIILLGVGAFWIVTKYRQITGDEAAKGSHPTEAIVSAPATPQPVAATPAPVPAPVAVPVATPPRVPVSAPVVQATPAARPQQPSQPVLRFTNAVPTAVPVIRPAATPLAAIRATPPSNAPAVIATPAPAANRGLQLATATPGQVSAPAPVAQAQAPRTSDQDFVTPTAVSSTDPAARPAPASGVNEVLVATTKRTWVTVRKDDPKGPPIFSDYVYPSANPLKLKGARFFIDTPDPNSVQITKNGLPYAYQAPNIPVQ